MSLPRPPAPAPPRRCPRYPHHWARVFSATQLLVHSSREGELSPRAPEPGDRVLTGTQPPTQGQRPPALAAATTEFAWLAAGEGTGVGVERSEHPRARVGGPRVGRGLKRRQGSWGTRGSSWAPTGNGTIEHQRPAHSASAPPAEGSVHGRRGCEARRGACASLFAPWLLSHSVRWGWELGAPPATPLPGLC